MQLAIFGLADIVTCSSLKCTLFERSLQFRIEMSYDWAVDFIRQINPYTCFQASTVLDALENVDATGQFVTGRAYAENTVILREFIQMLKACNR